MTDGDNLVCFRFVIDLRGNKDPEAWDRILDSFINAVVEEGGGSGGGMHALGSNRYCESCDDREDWD